MQAPRGVIPTTFVFSANDDVGHILADPAGKFDSALGLAGREFDLPVLGRLPMDVPFGAERDIDFVAVERTASTHGGFHAHTVRIAPPIPAVLDGIETCATHSPAVRARTRETTRLSRSQQTNIRALRPSRVRTLEILARCSAMPDPSDRKSNPSSSPAPPCSATSRGGSGPQSAVLKWIGSSTVAS